METYPTSTSGLFHWLMSKRCFDHLLQKAKRIVKTRPLQAMCKRKSINHVIIPSFKLLLDVNSLICNLDSLLRSYSDVGFIHFINLFLVTIKAIPECSICLIIILAMLRGNWTGKLLRFIWKIEIWKHTGVKEIWRNKVLIQ